MEAAVSALSDKADLEKEATRAYETLLRCRDLELNLHSTRSTLCLVVEGALLSFVALVTHLRSDRKNRELQYLSA
jgi:hypothetical protein